MNWVCPRVKQYLLKLSKELLGKSYPYPNDFWQSKWQKITDDSKALQSRTTNTTNKFTNARILFMGHTTKATQICLVLHTSTDRHYYLIFLSPFLLLTWEYAKTPVNAIPVPAHSRSYLEHSTGESLKQWHPNHKQAIGWCAVEHKREQRKRRPKKKRGK